MVIEQCEELKVFETMPTEGTLYLTAVHYVSGGWLSGPSGFDKALVINSLSTWSGIDSARIYSVKVPLDAHPA